MADADSIRLWEDLKLGYTESLGHPELRETIAGLYDGIDRDDILVAVPEEGIFLSMQALLDPGDHLICTFPGYQSLYEVALSIGCRVDHWQPVEEQGWRFDVEHLEKLLRPDTKLIAVNFPHNPTGYLPPGEDFQALLELVRGRNIHLLSDEMYRYLELDEAGRLPAVCACYDKGISLSGLSKSFGLPGLRIGWLATRDHELRDRMSRLKDYTTICGSAPSEILGLIALRQRHEIISMQKRRIQRNLALLDDFFRERRDMFRWNRPLGGTICFPRMMTVGDTFSFCEKLVRETRIMLAPSRVFQYGDNHVRIGFGRENLPEVLERFGHYLDRFEIYSNCQKK